MRSVDEDFFPAWSQAINARDAVRVASLCTEEIVWEDWALVTAEPLHGRAAVIGRSRRPKAKISVEHSGGEGRAISPHGYVALLRNITNLPMKPFRDAMEELGFTNVASYATSGNLMFDARARDTRSFERRIGGRLGTQAFVRTRAEMARVVDQDPLGATVMFLAHPPTAAKRRAFLDLDFQEPHPVLRGRTIYLSFPLLLRGRSTPFDIERSLDIKGTLRTARVAATLLARMSEGAQAARRSSSRRGRSGT